MTVGRLLSQAIRLFLIARQADSYSPETLKQYDWALNRFLAQGDKPIAEVTTDDIRLFLSYFQTAYVPTRPNGDKTPLSGASIFAAWKAIRAFYKWASPELGIANPSAKIPAPRHMEPLIIPLKQDEIKMLLKACENNNPTRKTEKRNSFILPRNTAVRDRAIVLTLLDTGLRASELCRLVMSDLDLNSGSVVVRAHLSGIKSRPRTIPLGSSSRKALAMYVVGRDKVGRDDPVFLREDGKGPMNRTSLLHLLEAMGTRCGIYDVHPHKFRHTFAIQYLRNGGDLFTLQRMLGHTSLEMTRKYLALAQTDDTAAHRKASPADNWHL